MKSGNAISVEELGKVKVYDEKRGEVELASFWSTGAVALVFVRHFG